ncbi:rhodanese-like domain-containing protein [Paenibacillus sp. FSL K6-2862]|uniref:rhodanese-like domain-containing protein n=1 Tax=Paenibacillus sp. FSL K6-2862 TaxID=2921484 RepID=UPI0030F60B96
MIILFYILVGLLGSWLLIQLWPLRSLTYIPVEEWEPLKERWVYAKILDVRDASEYEAGHIPGSINVSIGRLPLLWGKHITPSDEVIIFSRSWIQSRKAARILARRGFRSLYAIKGCYLSMSVSDTSEKQQNYKSNYCQ